MYSCVPLSPTHPPVQPSDNSRIIAGVVDVEQFAEELPQMNVVLIAGVERRSRSRVGGVWCRF
jgi:hypothetical protein